MNKFIRDFFHPNQWIFYLLFLPIYSLSGLQPTNSKITALYNTLDPTSISQHFAFYELYSDYTLGQKALGDAWQLLSDNKSNFPSSIDDIPLSVQAIHAIILLVNKPIDQEISLVHPDAQKTLIKLSHRLHHYSLQRTSCLERERDFRASFRRNGALLAVFF